MAQIKVAATIEVAGASIVSKLAREADGLIFHDPTLAPGKAGTLTTRTDANTGVATLGAGHGITDADKVDVYWAGGLRHGMDVTAYDGTTITVDGGAGDDLPAQGAALVVGVRQEIDVDFDGDDVQFLSAHCPERAHVDFQTGASVSVHAQELPAEEAWTWAADQGVANPLGGDPVGKVLASCGSTAGGKLTIAGVRDSTP
ncbi:MAG: hypothetical protein JW809_14970 [Pirellulales bacterium]|nr:hypothetical protein [Pirellulales bacterium]